MNGNEQLTFLLKTSHFLCTPTRCNEQQCDDNIKQIFLFIKKRSINLKNKKTKKCLSQQRHRSCMKEDLQLKRGTHKY